MASRKGSLSLGPRPIKGPGPAGMAPVSVAYAEALQVVSDERMRQACRLLLAEPKGEGDKAGPTDVDKLLAYYKECEKAVSVIRKESPSDVFMPPPSVPLAGPLSRSGTAGAARPHAKPLKGVTMIRGRMMGRMHPPGTGASSDRRGLLPLGQKQDSDSSLGSGNSGGAKKFLQTEELIPPPQARQFLAKLNKDDSARTAKTTKAKSASSTPVPPPPSRTTKKSSQAKKEHTSKKSKAVEEEDEEEEEEEPSRQSQSRRKRSASTSSPPVDADSSESASSAPTGRRVQPRRGTNYR
jgi:hypothetical protein